MQIWEEAGVTQCLADEHLVAELVPRVIAHLANRHGAVAGESTAMLDNELLLQVTAPTRPAFSAKYTGGNAG